MAELLNCPFCGAKDITARDNPRDPDNASEAIGPASVHCSSCGGGIFGDWIDEAIAAWNRRPSPSISEGEEVEAAAPGREVLLFTSYCGGDNPDCSAARPCPACLGMSNVFTLPAGVTIHYARQLAPDWNNTDPASKARATTEVEVAVKPLVWKPYGDFEHHASRLGMVYIIMRRIPASGETFILETHGVRGKQEFKTLEAAQAAADAHNATRIRSALVGEE